MTKVLWTQQMIISTNINGKLVEKSVEPRKLLSDFIREDCGLTGTHVGCEHGVCGACTVLVDGTAVRSCLMFAVQADGAEIKTVEGLKQEKNGPPLQDAFSECHGLQCGFCTPGILMSSLEFLETNPNPCTKDITEMLSGHLCRCTGYKGMIEAIHKVSNKNL
ncbi:carbon-monoxide dehydrogenase small subunit/2-furoyl-CoA dehydrogenase 2Fe-2S iron sulfur subunit [Evansella vedderi]|uniref:Carbon-monoxide dehydrogenase small subunit/2-furoyl-CoA dehydrogenase 2Fe-2S iron sulfur subunit n=1 Tax=Evansella vedderi TaxID=38282 RepID=A0ABT9ZQ63_9BACI|nr:(2Fe-2S)-binding protein [Evansella vedderi]MDQ0253380.1 carbon-monoxide dehydrogenase small subunit/2-furoyl-CoA dehydrogenase 2Fe-2S iron sulfur subunit [Evansella vedderi]